MNFYKIIAKAGHQGTGRYQDIPVFLSERNISEAMSHLKRLPMVKKGHNFTTTHLTMIDEKEFVVGSITNQYHKYINNKDVEAFNPLEQIAHRLRFVLKEYVFTTDEGKKLYEFCTKFQNATEEEKESIMQDYGKWANKLISKETSPETNPKSL